MYAHQLRGMDEKEARMPVPVEVVVHIAPVEASWAHDPGVDHTPQLVPHKRLEANHMGRARDRTLLRAGPNFQNQAARQ